MFSCFVKKLSSDFRTPGNLFPVGRPASRTGARSPRRALYDLSLCLSPALSIRPQRGPNQAGRPGLGRPPRDGRLIPPYGGGVRTRAARQNLKSVSREGGWFCSFPVSIREPSADPPEAHLAASIPQRSEDSEGADKPRCPSGFSLWATGKARQVRRDGGRSSTGLGLVYPAGANYFAQQSIVSTLRLKSTHIHRSAQWVLPS